jgi:hypothetical protein
MQKLTASVKKFWNAHKGQIAIFGIITTVLAVALNRTIVKQHNEFLTEKGLIEEYYAIEE